MPNDGSGVASLHGAPISTSFGAVSVAADRFLRNILRGFFQNIPGAHATFPSAIHERFGMLALVIFRDEATPALRKETLKNGRQIFRWNFAPPRGVAVRAKESGLPVVPVDFTEGRLAVGTGLAKNKKLDEGTELNKGRLTPEKGHSTQARCVF